MLQDPMGWQIVVDEDMSTLTLPAAPPIRPNAKSLAFDRVFPVGYPQAPPETSSCLMSHLGGVTGPPLCTIGVKERARTMHKWLHTNTHRRSHSGGSGAVRDARVVCACVLCAHCCLRRCGPTFAIPFHYASGSHRRLHGGDVARALDRSTFSRSSPSRCCRMSWRDTTRPFLPTGRC